MTQDAGAGDFTGPFLFQVDIEDDGQRLDRALASAASKAGLSVSRTRLQNLMAEGHVRLGGRPVLSGKTRVATGDIISLDLPPPTDPVPVGEAIPLEVVFEDSHLLIVDKPAGLVVHPAAGHPDGTLVNALIAHCGASLSGVGGVKRPGIVHRLDQDTSGLLVVAKHDAAHAGLSALFADHGRSGSLVREYQAFVWGCPERASGSIDAAIGRDPHNRLKMAIVSASKGRQAVTHWQREAAFGTRHASRVRCRLETGRTHQIRVHLASIGHPVIGDDVYGSGFRTKEEALLREAGTRARPIGRQALHAATLGFVHPITGQDLLFRSELPVDLALLDQALGKLAAGTA